MSARLAAVSVDLDEVSEYVHIHDLAPLGIGHDAEAEERFHPTIPLTCGV